MQKGLKAQKKQEITNLKKFGFFKVPLLTVIPYTQV
jgi:hypothetical protein